MPDTWYRQNGLLVEMQILSIPSTNVAAWGRTPIFKLAGVVPSKDVYVPIQIDKIAVEISATSGEVSIANRTANNMTFIQAFAHIIFAIE